MRAKLKPVITSKSQSILVKNDKMRRFYAPLHYHPEYEIIYIKKSFGMRVVGNNIDNYYPGEVIILGPGLPHYHEVGTINTDDDTPIETIAVLFPESIFEANSQFPEFLTVNRLLNKIKYGIELNEHTKEDVQTILEKMTLEPSLTNLLSIYSIIDVLSRTNSSFTQLSTQHYDNKRLHNAKMKYVQNYLKEHYLENVRLKEVSELIGLSKTAFCNYFKSQTGHTYTYYLNLLRISKACELLVSSTKNVSQIAFEVGYENLGYFNRKFLEIKGKTPKAFRKSISIFE